MLLFEITVSIGCLATLWSADYRSDEHNSPRNAILGRRASRVRGYLLFRTTTYYLEYRLGNATANYTVFRRVP